MKRSNNHLTGIEFLYANEAFLAVHKNPGIPCQSRSDKPPYPLDKSLGEYLNESVKLWTRIDQPVSGIVLFYRESHTPGTIDLTIIEKTYLGIVEGHPDENKEKVLVSYIRRDGRRMKALEDKTKGKLAELSWKVLKAFDNYTLLKIRPKTGRFHQIRHQLAEMGHPIKGDVKYGARRKNADRSIHLHAMEYVIRQHDGEQCRVIDHSFPEDPLWKLAKGYIP